MKWLIVSVMIFGAYYNAIAQEFTSPKAQIIKTVKVDASSETITAAWFFPTDHFLFAKQFEKVEFGIKLPASVQHKIEGYFRQDKSIEDRINPFDRHEIDITCELLHNGVKERTIDGFYYEEFFRDLRLQRWSSDSTSFPFRIRVAPKQIGEYVLKVKFEALGVQTTSFELNFEVEASTHKGLLEKGVNERHMRFSKSKEGFFGIGQVIPWTEWNSWRELPSLSKPGQFMPFYRSLSTLSASGGNFTRFVAAPWFMQLEWEALGNYGPAMGHAWEFDRINDLCNEQEIYFIFCALLHSPLEKRTDEEQDELPGIRWETYCYNDQDKTPTRLPHEQKIGLKDPVDFYTNEKAFDLQQNYFRYLISRWGYSPALAGWQLMSEADQTCDYRDHTDESGNMIDNSENRLAVNRWTKKMSEYMEYECGDDHMKSIAFIVGKNFSSYLWDPEIYKQKEMDFMGLHDYIFETENPYHVRNRNLIKRFETVNNLSVGIDEGNIIHPEFQKKMYIFDEFGHVTIVPVQWPEDKDDNPCLYLNNCFDFSFKQDLWFTMSSG
ncbi:MAG: hypothetical protein MK066_10100, partial [Crocinitomicaceae bacterium]|nr:hypothetical protein [Crocinitomicaceae bacterium]